MTACPIPHHLNIPEAGDITIPFGMQPIVQVADGRVKACELLYRGIRPANWAEVDSAIVKFPSTPARFAANVRQSFERGPDRTDDETFAQILSVNNVTFKLSEVVSGYIDRAATRRR